jgi:hypothetical protein
MPGSRINFLQDSKSLRGFTQDFSLQIGCEYFGDLVENCLINGHTGMVLFFLPGEFRMAKVEKGMVIRHGEELDSRPLKFNLDPETGSFLSY